VVEIKLRVNGAETALDLEPRESLLDVLRERMGLTGTKKGCDQGACGACTVLADGERINSCLALAVQYAGREITTIEGVAAGDRPHPLQTAFVRHDGLQCGYCTPGQVCSASMPSAVTADVSAESVPLTDAEIRERMSGNLCRCGAYNGIVAAIRETAEGARR
jgi:xanthine dehydrogenase YagT iron-sulfur-binding subunit